MAVHLDHRGRDEVEELQRSRRARRTWWAVWCAPMPLDRRALDHRGVLDRPAVARERSQQVVVADVVVRVEAVLQCLRPVHRRVVHHEQRASGRDRAEQGGQRSSRRRAAAPGRTH